MITTNKFKSTTPAVQRPLQIQEDPSWGCHHCPNKCALCKDFLIEAKTFTSPKSVQTFKIRSNINCQTKYVVYLIFDKKCDDVFNIGYTMDSMAVRWRNHKSHIKNKIHSCELATHFISNSDTIHKIDRSNHKNFTSQLSDHLSVLIESVEPRPGIDIEPIMKEREDYWQGVLKSTTFYGGINKRSNKIQLNKFKKS